VLLTLGCCAHLPQHLLRQRLEDAPHRHLHVVDKLLEVNGMSIYMNIFGLNK
jgi:hypothetical protein